jgi:double-stranded uracil-DNA glycosylase
MTAHLEEERSGSIWFAMKKLTGFPAVGKNNPKLLILGTMPGETSLRAGQYYAHPRNLFWPIMGELIGARPELSYNMRLRIAARADIGLWNVLESCSRTGSLDSAIRDETVYDFMTFLRLRPRVTHIFFNGKKAGESFRRHVLPNLEKNRFVCIDLPSTSPAHARLDFSAKLAAWRILSTI